MEHKKTKEIKPLDANFLISRGECCGSGCRNCPYIPKWTEGCKTTLDKTQNRATLETK